MGRPKKQNREPFWREGRNCWYVQQGSTQIRLSPDKDEAWRIWHELMAKKPEERKPVATSDPFVVQIIDDFLEWASCNRTPATYDIYQRLGRVALLWGYHLFSTGSDASRHPTGPPRC